MRIAEEIFPTINGTVIDPIQIKCLQQWRTIFVFIGKSTIPSAVGIASDASMSRSIFLSFSLFFSLVFLLLGCRQLLTGTKVPSTCSIHIALVDALNQSYLDPAARDASRFVYMDSPLRTFIYVYICICSRKKTLLDRVHV